ncbi:MAG: hypothetical protein HOK49_15520 [Opitutae bacterium]|nr:hypothetical protein [Opitutae bacterium]
MSPEKKHILILIFAGLTFTLFNVLSAQDAIELEKKPVAPPQSPLYYLKKYAQNGVPATIHGNQPIVILGKRNEKGLVEGVNHQGYIRYRPCRRFKIESKPEYGYRFSGYGYDRATNPVLELQLGHSYIFEIDDVGRYPFLIYQPNPAKPFEKVKYKSYEILNNGSDLQQVRFTPSPDTPEQLAYLNQEFSRMKGQIRINKNLAPDDGEVIFLSVNYRRALVDQYISLLAQGFIEKSVPLGTDSLELYDLVNKGFNSGEGWYANLKHNERPGYSLFLLNVDPKPLVSSEKFSATFPRPSLIEERKVYRMSEKLKPVESKIYLLSVLTRTKESDPFIEKLIRQEQKYQPSLVDVFKAIDQINIKKKQRERLQQPLDPYLDSQIMIKLSEARGTSQVNSKRSLEDFKGIRGAFDQLLSGFKNLSITYTIDNESLQTSRLNIIQGNFDQGLLYLRPIVYPVIKLASIPKYFGNHRISKFQDLIEELLDALIQAGSAEATPENYKVAYAQEAFTILYILPLIELENKNFIRKALDVVGMLARTGSPDDMKRARVLLSIIPFEKTDENMVNSFFSAAGDFRSAGNFQDALSIYQQFLNLPESPYYREACLWSAFCKASSDPPQFGAAQLFLEQFRITYKDDGGSPSRDDSIYSLWRLIEALLAYKDPQASLEDAMDKVSEAVVYSRIGYSWVPEILALSAKCYKEKKKTDTAKEVYRELKVFFPKHPKTLQFELDFPEIAKE